MNIKIRLTVMNFLQFAVWGAYLTSMGTYLAGVGLGSHIGIFYAMQGVTSVFFMPCRESFPFSCLLSWVSLPTAGCLPNACWG